MLRFPSSAHLLFWVGSPLSGEPHQFSGCVQHYTFHTPNQCPYPLKIQTGHQVDSSKTHRKKNRPQTRHQSFLTCRSMPNYSKSSHNSMVLLLPDRTTSKAVIFIVDVGKVYFWFWSNVFGVTSSLPSRPEKETAKVSISEPHAISVISTIIFGDRSKNQNTAANHFGTHSTISKKKHQLHERGESWFVNVMTLFIYFMADVCFSPWN